VTDQHYDDYFCDLIGVTTCRYRLVGQQTSCRGYGVTSYGRRASDNTCTWFRAIGDGQWLCTNPEATRDALRRFKEMACMEVKA